MKNIRIVLEEASNGINTLSNCLYFLRVYGIARFQISVYQWQLPFQDFAGDSHTLSQYPLKLSKSWCFSHFISSKSIPEAYTQKNVSNSHITSSLVTD